MKKNIVQIIFFLVVTLIVGLLIGKNFAANKQVNEIKPDYFVKSQECSKYRTSVETKLKEQDLSIPKTKTEVMNSLDKIFYSPKLNSCLYVATETMWVDDRITFVTPTLTDALTGELLLAGLREMGTEDYLTRKKQFEKIVHDYE